MNTYASWAAMMIGEAAVHIIEGEGTWQDGVSFVLGSIAVASMATGVGEVAVGLVTIGWEIYELAHSTK